VLQEDVFGERYFDFGPQVRLAAKVEAPQGSSKQPCASMVSAPGARCFLPGTVLVLDFGDGAHAVKDSTFLQCVPASAEDRIFSREHW
jgi:hypothetical protein